MSLLLQKLLVSIVPYYCTGTVVSHKVGKNSPKNVDFLFMADNSTPPYLKTMIKFFKIKFKVVKIFDRDTDGNIDYYEFISALHPRDSYTPANDAEKIEDEVIREVSRCRCCERFAIHQISDNKYRVRHHYSYE